MYESSQALVLQILTVAALVGVGALIAAIFTDPAPELFTNGDSRQFPPQSDRLGRRATRIGNEKDQSAAAIECRARVAAGWTGDGSADYCGTSARTGAPTTKPATAEKIGPSF
jgi:hypothetical protein